MKFNVVQQKGKFGNGSIKILFYIDREKVTVNTHVFCDSKNWDLHKGRVKITDVFASDKNLIIDNTLARINEVFVRYRLRNKKLTRAIFNKAYNKPDDFENFHVFCETKKRIFAKKIENSTFTNHEITLAKLKEFRDQIHFDEINEEFLVDFFCFLQKKKKNSDNTAYKNMSILKKYVRAAVKEKYIEENPFDNFPIREGRFNPVYLEEHELNLIIQIYKEGSISLNKYKTLQLFLFMCFGSQHVGDAKKMMISQIGEKSFDYFRKKNKNRKPEKITVPVSPGVKFSLIINTLLFNSLHSDRILIYSFYLNVIYYYFYLENLLSEYYFRFGLIHTFK